MLKIIEKILATCLYLIILIGCCFWFYIIFGIGFYCYLIQIINETNLKLTAFVVSILSIFSILLLRDLYVFSKEYKDMLKKK